MNYSLKLREEAAAEFNDAYVWYEEQQENLGEQFRVTIQNKLKLIRKDPHHYKTAYKKFHQALTDKFPFLIIYTINEKNKQILVTAIFHTSRNPKNKFKR